MTLLETLKDEQDTEDAMRRGIDELVDSRIADRAERADKQAWRRDREYRRNT